MRRSLFLARIALCDQRENKPGTDLHQGPPLRLENLHKAITTTMSVIRVKEREVLQTQPLLPESTTNHQHKRRVVPDRSPTLHRGTTIALLQQLPP